MNDELKSQYIMIRVSPKEKKELELKAKQARMTVSRYLVTSSQDKKIHITEKIPDLYLEITRIGVNINQIAHVANSQKYVSARQLQEVMDLMKDVKLYMAKVVDSLEDEEEVTYQTLEKRMSVLENKFEQTERKLDRIISFIEKRTDGYGGS